MNVLLLDPWNTSQIFLLEVGKNIILGPIIDKNSKLRHPIEFMYEDKGNNIYYLYTVNNDSTDFKHLYLKINSNGTIIENISMQDQLMQDEIFGPILPVITYNQKEEVLDWVDKNPFPLSIYIYADNKQVQDFYISRLR
jgi:acyl-CoA reductase-like NAD-dependent aldehyde dehydrogenase